MELNITKLVTGITPSECSGSIAERGPNAAMETWGNAKEKAGEIAILDTPEKIAAMKGYMGEFGAWDDSEIAAWDNQEVNALLVQLVAGDMREYSDAPIQDWDWADYQELTSAGQVAGQLFKGDDGEYYYYIGI